MKRKYTADLDRRFELEEIRLGKEDLARGGAESTDVILRELDLAHSSGVAELQEAIDDVVEHGGLHSPPRQTLD